VTRYRRLKPQQRREQLLDTAAAMFAEKPYEDVFVEEIAARGCVASDDVSLLSEQARLIRRDIKARQWPAFGARRA
jgi:hypothetical protein